jgi:endonuclease/exonuclease/phosphatase family metal-dependent hydrolase
MGDLNTVGDEAQMNDPDSQYSQLQKTLTAARPNWIDLGRWMDPAKWGTGQPEAKNGGERIDYILLSNGPTGRQLRPITARTRSFPNPRVQYLSDHSAVEAELDY